MNQPRSARKATPPPSVPPAKPAARSSGEKRGAGKRTASEFPVGFHPDVPLYLLEPSPYQKRVFPANWAEQPETRELVASIEGGGVRIPVLVRPHPAKPDKLQLMAGERRARASRLANRGTIPAIVLDATDAEAADRTYCENHWRESLGLWGEVDTVIAMLAAHRGEVAVVAANLGRTPAWVKLRERIAGLPTKWREATGPEGELEEWTAAHLELIARYDPEGMREPEEFDGYWSNGIDSLRHHLNADDRRLKSAVWSMDDPALAEGRPACCDCRSRSDVEGQRELFEDEDPDAGDPKKPGKTARCLFGDCWRRKSAAFSKRKFDALRADHPGAVAMVDGGMNYHNEQALKKVFGTYTAKYQTKPAKKGDPGAVPAVIVHGPRAGRVEWIKPPKAAKASGGGKAAAAGPKPLAERRQLLAKRRWMLALEALRKLVGKTQYADLLRDAPDNERLGVFLGLVPVFDLAHDHSSTAAAYKRVRAVHETPRHDHLEAAARIYPLLRERMAAALAPPESAWQVDERKTELAREIADLFSIDLPTLADDAAKALPEPKSWAKLEREEAAARAGAGGNEAEDDDGEEGGDDE